jgi:hypothetical protein
MYSAVQVVLLQLYTVDLGHDVHFDYAWILFMSKAQCVS